MSIDTTIPISSVTYNGDALQLAVEEPNLITKEVTENKTYKASDDGADGYSEVVVNVASSGGGGSGGVVRKHGEFRCVARDYDGSILKEEWLDEGDVFELPEFPEHERLIAQEWSSPAPIVDNKITVWAGDVNAGVIYDTKSGLTEFDVVLTKATGLTVNLNVSGTQDWGDGSSDTTKKHTYSNYGKYTITSTCTGLGGYEEASIFGDSASSQCVEARMSSKTTKVSSYAFYYCTGLLHVSFSNKTNIAGINVFMRCSVLKGVVLPQCVTALYDECFRNSYSISFLIIPNGVTQIGTRCISGGNVSIDEIILPDTLTSLGSYNSNPFKRLRLSNNMTSFLGGVYQKMYPFTGRVVIPSGVTNCASDKYLLDGSNAVLDFSNVTVVPTMANTSFLTSDISKRMNGQGKIIVPDALYDTWITTTGWSSFANYIYKASEV